MTKGKKTQKMNTLGLKTRGEDTGKISSEKKGDVLKEKEKAEQNDKFKLKESEKKKNITKKKGKNKYVEKAKKYFKIDKLPKDVQSSIPFRGAMRNGIIETYPGVFTKTLKLKDINFKIAPDEEQARIFKQYMNLLNSMSKGIKWQVTIYNYEIDKKETLRNIRIPPRKDGLNKYRQDLNNVLIGHLTKGNNCIKQEKYITISVEDDSSEHAVISLDNAERDINKNIRKIAKEPAKALNLEERLQLLYSIYNQDSDYSICTGYDDNDEEVFDLNHIVKQGASIKDIIGPASFDFRKNNSFKMGDTFGRVFFLKKVPSYLSTDFISDIADIQSNMLISVTAEAMEMEEAIRLVRAQLANIEAQVVNLNKRNMENGYMGALPPELEKAQESARELMADITGRNQNVFFCTVTVCIFARTMTQLDDITASIKKIAAEHIAPLEILQEQQEQGLNTALPLCRNDIFAERIYTTESAAVFIPYNSQEISQKNAVFYGLNQVTSSMILYDRLSGSNYNGLIFGYSGSGKSFTAKLEMVSVLLNKPNVQIFVIDPQGEYYPLCEALKGERIRIAPKSGYYINPLDLDLSSDEDDGDPITTKADFLFSMMEIMLGKNRTLEPEHRTILDRCVRKIYKSYVEYINSTNGAITFNPARCPQISDLYQELRNQGDYASTQLADILEMYVTGSFDTFGHRTNVKTNSRFVVYDIKNLGSGMKELGLHVCINDIWNRMIANSKNNIYTYFYIDEFHLLLESVSTTLFLKRIWKMARKWLGVPTGIMQNTEDLLRDADSRAIVNNTSFVIMLREPHMDRINLQELFSLSASQLEYITESDPGHGLIYNGKVVLPFVYEFPKNTMLYNILTTSHDTKDAKFA